MPFNKYVSGEVVDGVYTITDREVGAPIGIISGYATELNGIEHEVPTWPEVYRMVMLQKGGKTAFKLRYTPSKQVLVEVWDSGSAYEIKITDPATGNTAYGQFYGWESSFWMGIGATAARVVEGL